jgi:hypothetical protein
MLFTVPRSGDGLRLILEVRLRLLWCGDWECLGLRFRCMLGSGCKRGSSGGERDLSRLLLILESCKVLRKSRTGDRWVLEGRLLTGCLLLGECDCLLCLPYGDDDRCLSLGEDEYLRAAGEVLWLEGCLGGDQGDNFWPTGECLGGSLLNGERDRRLLTEGDRDTRRLGERGDPWCKSLLPGGDLPLDRNLSGLRDNDRK